MSRPYACVKPVVAVLMRLFFRVEVKNPEHVPLAGAVLLVANHSSLLDPPQARRQPLEPARSAAGRRGRAAAALVPGEGGAVPDPVVRAADPAAQRAASPARGAA